MLGRAAGKTCPGAGLGSDANNQRAETLYYISRPLTTLRGPGLGVQGAAPMTDKEVASTHNSRQSRPPSAISSPKISTHDSRLWQSLQQEGMRSGEVLGSRNVPPELLTCSTYDRPASSPRVTCRVPSTFRSPACWRDPITCARRSPLPSWFTAGADLARGLPVRCCAAGGSARDLLGRTHGGVAAGWIAGDG